MYFVLTIIFLLAVIALLPVYLKEIRPGHTGKTLCLKGLLSALFCAVGVCTALGYGNIHSRYSHLMLAGFALSFVGDLLLHRDKGMAKYICGGVSFLGAHLCFIFAYILTAKILLPAQPFMTKGQIIALVLLWALVVALFLVFKPNFKKLAPVIFLYAAVLMFMVVKAGYLGYLLYCGQYDNATLTTGLLCGGAGLFALSDAVLGIGFFTKPTYGKKATNIILYYCGQILLALTLGFVTVS